MVSIIAWCQKWGLAFMFPTLILLDILLVMHGLSDWDYVRRSLPLKIIGAGFMAVASPILYEISGGREDD